MKTPIKKINPPAAPTKKSSTTTAPKKKSSKPAAPTKKSTSPGRSKKKGTTPVWLNKKGSAPIWLKKKKTEQAGIKKEDTPTEAPKKKNITPVPANYTKQPSSEKIKPEGATDQDIDETFITLAAKALDYRVKITDEITKACITFAKLLIEGNKETNLTRMTSAESCMIGMFLDSLLFSRHINISRKSRILDIGTGAGFPGVVLAMMSDNLQITAIDSRHKKTDFIATAAEKMELNNIRAIHTRAEDLAAEKFDYVVARAVGTLSKTISIGLPHLKEHGTMIIACAETSFNKTLKSQFRIEMKSVPYLLPGYKNTFTHVIINNR
jgi:16S rRNA (guanine(527)-N(7))-methyltransferase RsmG